MRIAQIAPLFESVPPRLYGGTERVVHNLARGMTESGCEVTVFCSGDSKTYGEMEHVWPTALRLSPRPILDPFAYHVRMLEAVARQAHRFDAIHNHNDYPMLPLLRMTPTPVVSTAHNRMDHPDLRAVFEYFGDAPMISISDAQRRAMPGLNWLATVLHGIDPAEFDFHPRPGKYLAFLGRISPEKRPDWAIDMAQASGVPLKLAAKIDEKDQLYYERRIKPRIDGKLVEFVGEISEREKSEFLGNALALAFPIDWPEPFGLVMIEAMACGTPVLTRPVGSVLEVMQDGLSGFVRADVKQLARLAPAAARLDRAAVRRYCAERFSFERMTREYLNVYRHLTIERMADHRRDLLHPVDRTPNRHTKGVA
jgi:glycosyltransferase involved in cell wall biosynthesis